MEAIAANYSNNGFVRYDSYRSAMEVIDAYNAEQQRIADAARYQWWFDYTYGDRFNPKGNDSFVKNTSHVNASDAISRSPLDLFNSLFLQDYPGIRRSQQNDGNYINIKDIFEALDGSYTKNGDSVVARILFDGMELNMTYNLSDVELHNILGITWGSSSVDATVKALNTPTNYVWHTNVTYEKSVLPGSGTEYMNGSKLLAYLEKLVGEQNTQQKQEDLNTALIKFNKEKDITKLTAENIHDYYFETEQDAVYAFGSLYYPITQTADTYGKKREYGAFIIQEDYGYTFSEIVPGDPAGGSDTASVDLTNEYYQLNGRGQKMVASVHTHPNSGGFSDPVDYYGYSWGIERMYLIGPKDGDTNIGAFIMSRSLSYDEYLKKISEGSTNIKGIACSCTA